MIACDFLFFKTIFFLASVENEMRNIFNVNNRNRQPNWQPQPKRTRSDTFRKDVYFVEYYRGMTYSSASEINQAIREGKLTMLKFILNQGDSFQFFCKGQVNNIFQAKIYVNNISEKS